MPRRFNLKVDRQNIDVEEFRDFNELLRVCDERTLNSWAEYEDTARTARDDGWRGGSYDKARELLVYGWDEKMEAIKAKLETYKKANTGSKAKTFSSRVGYAPNVPNAIKGLPNSMFNTRLEAKKTKVLDVAVDLGVAARIDSGDVIDRAVEVVAKLMSLEASGYRVKISFLKTFNDSDNERSYCCKLVVKNEFQPLDIKRVAFPLGHPAMLRRIMFDWYERLPGAKRMSGYGTSMAFTTSNVRNALIKGLTNEKQFVIHYNTNLDELFQKLK